MMNFSATASVGKPSGKHTARWWLFKVLSFFPYVILTAMLAVSMLPLLAMVGTSFRSFEAMFATRSIFPDEWSLDFYRRVLNDPRMVNYFLNSILTATVTAFATVLVAVLGGYSLARFRKRVRGLGIFVTFILMVQMFPTLQMIIPLFLNFSAWGVMNTRHTLMMVYPAFTLPMSLMMMHAFIEGIPTELEEAGRIDGCTRFGVLWHLVLPVSKPGIASVAILAFNHAWNEFLLAMLFIRTDRYRTVPVGLHNFAGENSMDWGSIMAASVLMLVPILLFLNILQKHIVGGLTIGSVKG